MTPEEEARAAEARYVDGIPQSKLVEMIAQQTVKLFREQAARITALTAKVAALEAVPVMKFCGVWKTGQTYEPGSVVTFDGAWWHCNSGTCAKPGTIGEWQLCVKSQQGGRR